MGSYVVGVYLTSVALEPLKDWKLVMHLPQAYTSHRRASLTDIHLPQACVSPRHVSLTGVRLSPARMLNTLKKGDELIGMLSSTVTHGLRRGAATETIHLSKPLRGASDVEASRVLGHWPSERDSGITTAYVGYLREDAWNQRLKTPLEDHSRPALAPKPFKRSRQSTETALAICDELGLDPENKKDRIKAQETGKGDSKTMEDSQLEPYVDKEIDHAAKGYIDENDQATGCDHDEETLGGSGDGDHSITPILSCCT
jgi:hypothetical protein